MNKYWNRVLKLWCQAFRIAAAFFVVLFIAYTIFYRGLYQGDRNGWNRCMQQMRPQLQTEYPLVMETNLEAFMDSGYTSSNGSADETY